MTPFIIGSVFAVLQLFWSCVRHPLGGRTGLFGEHPFQGFISAAVLGGAIYGGVIWVGIFIWRAIS